MPQTPYCSESHNTIKTPQRNLSVVKRLQDSELFLSAASSDARKQERHVMKLAIMNGINQIMCEKFSSVLEGICVQEEEVCIELLSLPETQFRQDMMTVMSDIAMVRDDLELTMLHHFLEKFHFQEQLKIIKMAMSSGEIAERRLAGEVARVLKSQRRE